MEVAEKDFQRIKRGKGSRKKCRFTFSTHFMTTRFFKKPGFSEDFKYDFAKATKTGNVGNIINTIRSRLQVTGFKSFLPSPRHICRKTAEIVVHFTIFCKPEKTFSGFGSDLVSCVEADAFLSLKTTELQGYLVRKLCDWWYGGYQARVQAPRSRHYCTVDSQRFLFAGKSVLF